MHKIFVEEIFVFYFFDRWEFHYNLVDEVEDLQRKFFFKKFIDRWEFHYNLDDEVEGKNIRVDFRVVLVLFANFVYRERAFFMLLADV
jgi:hypothetical protein